MERVERMDGLMNESGNKYVDQKSYDKTKWFKEQGWGYKDTQFQKHSDGIVRLSGSKYSIGGEKLSNFIPWIEENLGLDTKIEPKKGVNELIVDEPKVNDQFMIELNKVKMEMSVDGRIRAFHSHGQSLQEIYKLRMGRLDKYVDLVVYPNESEQIERMVQLANQFNVVLIVFGGGTNVSQALMLDTAEQRMIVSVDMSKMNRILWVDKKNMMAKAQAGILGQDLEKGLGEHGVIIGHEPDSVEFSTLGGWVSTRASGMKKNKYGNIDDIILNVRIVTSIGTFEKQQNAPRVSSGPDINQLVLGSEGTLGIITEVVFKVRSLPEQRLYESFIFSDFESGSKFMHSLVKHNCYPASCRLVDNQQFQLGMSLKTENKQKRQIMLDKLKKYYLLNIKGFKADQLVLCTILFEGSKKEIQNELSICSSQAKEFKGIKTGPQNGERGYFLTFAIAYLRDFAMNYELIGESFETSVPWSNVLQFCETVKTKVLNECKAQKIPGIPLLSFRLTQLYETGCAIYIYFGMMYKGLADPVGTYEKIEHLARQTIIDNGGSISHHHGVGKIRKMFMDQSVGPTGQLMLQKIKSSIDPKNIFATSNLVSKL